MTGQGLEQEYRAPWCIYEDKDIIVCHKPAGIAVQSARIGQKDMESELNNYLAQKREQVYVVHRLDQPVEGIVVFAKHKKAAAQLTRQITQGTMKKFYTACCCYDQELPEAVSKAIEQTEKSVSDGRSEEGYWIHLEDYLIKDGRTNTSRIGKKGQKDAKLAVLDYQVLRHDPEAKQVIVRIHLHTGRHHQIRVQMANAGLPLYGDAKYNHITYEPTDCDKVHKEQLQYAGRTVALCATELQFFDINTGNLKKYVVKSKHPTLNEAVIINKDCL